MLGEGVPREPPAAERALSSQTLTYEIILTLGQAFEVAYQLALQAQRARPVGASAAEPVETRSSKPVPKPRVGVRKSAVRGPLARAHGVSHTQAAAPQERAWPLGSRCPSSPAASQAHGARQLRRRGRSAL